MYYIIKDYEPMTCPKLIQVEPVEQENSMDLFYLVINGERVKRATEYLDLTVIESVAMNLNEFEGFVASAKAIETIDRNGFTVREFTFNGFFVTMKEEMMLPIAKFVKWSKEPGFFDAKLSGGSQRYIPTCAVENVKFLTFFLPQRAPSRPNNPVRRC